MSATSSPKSRESLIAAMFQWAVRQSSLQRSVSGAVIYQNKLVAVAGRSDRTNTATPSQLLEFQDLVVARHEQ